MKKIVLNPIYFIFVIFLLIKGYFLIFINYLIALIFHEFAHFYVARELGYRLQKLEISPFGVCLNYSDVFFAEDDEFKIAIAGPVINFILSFIVVAFWWFFPVSYYFTRHFFIANITLAVFNMLPCFPLDGGRVLINFIAKKKTREFAIKVTEIINYVVALMLFACFIVSIFFGINITYLLLSLFLIVGAINPKNKVSFDNLKMLGSKEKMLSKGTSIKFIAVSNDMPLYKIRSKFSRFKYNIVFVVQNGKVKTYSESAIETLMLKYGSDATINKIQQCYFLLKK